MQTCVLSLSGRSPQCKQYTLRQPLLSVFGTCMFFVQNFYDNNSNDLLFYIIAVFLKNITLIYSLQIKKML